MEYKYLARTNKGTVEGGIVESPNEAAALKGLQDRGLVIIKLESLEGASIFSFRSGLFKRVKQKEIFVFFRQLSVLIEAGVPLVESLKSLSEQEENTYFKEVIMEMANDIEGGVSFSNALSKHSKIFSNFCINLMRAGEVAGRLQESLTYLADYLEREYYLVSKVRGAMIYPAFILFVFLVIGILVMVMIMPNLISILKETGQELPWPTKVVIAVSEFFTHWFWLLIILFVGTGFGLRYYYKTPAGRRLWDNIELKMPVFGRLFQKTYLSRFADNLSALVKGGVPILQALEVSSQVIDNTIFQEIIIRARDEVRVGKNISFVLEEYEEFPPLFTQMIKTGERSGKVDVILGKLAIFYNKEVDSVVGNLTQLIEPILIIALALITGVLVGAVFMPIYNMVGAF